MNELWDKRLLIFTILKYSFTTMLILYSHRIHQNHFYVMISLLELISIALFSNYLLRINKWLAFIINSLALLLLNAQMLMMIFGGSYVTLVMLTNLESIEAIGGKLKLYLSGVIALVMFSLMPIKRFKVPYVSTNKLLSISLLSELILTLMHGSMYSPFFAIYQLRQDAKAYQRQLEEIANQPNITSEFYREHVDSAIQRPENIKEKPNVVLLFVEGLSQNIIDDSRAIMPTVAKVQKESLNFSNYYNHTFATYRGIIGQLYSGYQLDNYDNNTLISIQDVLANEGYQTSFINVEPSNTQFTTYLESLNFQNLISDPSKSYSGHNGTVSDKEAFEILYDTIEQQAKEDKPFFTAMYTFGTHITLNSPHEKYGDGHSPLLNRFYNFDVQFKKFIEKFKESGLAQNTVLVFAVDHATYQDAEFISVFPGYARANPDVDIVPFFMYHDGIMARTVDVKGRNSIDMAPTILDYMDINRENYFLGTSLFFPKENNNSFDTVFFDNSFLLSTDQNRVEPLSEASKEIIEAQLQKYFAAKTQPPMKP
ncbi:sulfatase-like hydrolase/transferase [Streptococcus sp. zg-86]|uniref:Sulfatase-like hydrolase/transferase n=1 Tax=Streptococcus zhangguiae TaxID=2664091 RepID=A0A6I4RDJ8_9STRE|nr:sulfatase-like hydrolase/transferase [Streptococcus sp. zg-86]MTB91119.1 sulfatase-like hydrolase/transferase [Streptococcus sp. zg-36]MWV56798.1 sulfatase-like hydrolase/transferase [Streptococcus sp. zg-70]QTH48718.1 sulfatase-like hydrolase/transferase [Streptococcus sp. zg-86]